MVPVPDVRLEQLAAIAKPQRVVPTTMQFIDIAGLVAGASKGEGLGNQFLAHIREAHAIAHVVRCFEDDNVIHVAGKISPKDDIEVIETELILADLQGAEKAIQRLGRQVKGLDNEIVKDKAALERAFAHLNETKPLRTLELSEDEKRRLRQFHFLTVKPVMYIANVREDGFENNPLLDQVRAIAAEEGAEVVAVCNQLEAEIADLEDADKQEFLAAAGLTEPGLDRVIRAGHQLLGLEAYFTVGPKEVRAWTIRSGSTAPEAAAVIHTDFQRGFIRAEVVAFDDFIKYGGEQGAKDAGRKRSEGKEYIVQDGDVVHFLFNV